MAMTADHGCERKVWLVPRLATHPFIAISCKSSIFRDPLDLVEMAIVVNEEVSNIKVLVTLLLNDLASGAMVYYDQDICIQPGVLHPRAATHANQPRPRSDFEPLSIWFRTAFDPICFKTGSESDQKRLKIRSGSGLVRKGGCFRLGLDLAGPNLSILWGRNDYTIIRKQVFCVTDVRVIGKVIPNN